MFKKPHYNFSTIAFILFLLLLCFDLSANDNDLSQKANQDILRELESSLLNSPEDNNISISYKNNLKAYLIDSYNNANIKSSLEFCKKAIFHFPEDKDFKEIVIVIYFENAKILFKEGNFSLAIEYLKLCQGISNTPEIFKKPIIDILIKQSRKLYDERSFIKAKNALSHILYLDKENPYALYRMGQILLEENKLKEALAYWQKIKDDNIVFADKINHLKKDINLQERYKKVSWNNFDFYSPYESKEISYSLRNEISNVFRQMGSDFNYYPNYQIVVILYPPDSYKNIRESRNIFYPAAGFYDGKIRLPLLEGNDLSQTIKTIRHEYTHLIIRDLTLDNAPIWINEGIAEYQESLDREAKKQDFKKIYKKEGFIPIDSLSQIFLDKSDNNKLNIAYLESFAIIDYIVTKFRFQTLLDILEDFKDGYKEDEVFKKNLARNPQELIKEVEEFIKERY